MKKYVCHIFILPINLYKFVLPKRSSGYQGSLWVLIFQCTSMALVSQGHKDFDHNENNYIWSKAIRLSGKKIEKWKLQQKIIKTLIFSYRLKVLEIFSFIFDFLIRFLCTDHYSYSTLTLLVIWMVIRNTRQTFRRIVNPFPT